jgi:hypothetical protein
LGATGICQGDAMHFSSFFSSSSHTTSIAFIISQTKANGLVVAETGATNHMLPNALVFIF